MVRANADVDAPAVSVVIATRDRPELLRRAVGAALGQRYEGSIECVVVFDQSEPHELDVASLDGAARRLVVARNTRSPGLAGARNSGVLTSTGDLVAFCDDDDEWLEGKLRRQVDLLTSQPDAIAVATGIQVRTEAGDHERRSPPRADFEDFLESRIMAIHPSSLVVRRDDLLGRVGLVDESLPGSFGEDYEFLLRATRHGPVRSVPDPLVRVHWNRPSFFAGRWEAIVDGLTYVLERFPEFDEHPRARARIEAQVAFALAAQHRRRESWRWARRSLRHRPFDPRAWSAIVVSTRAVSAERLVRLAQRRGKGL